MLASEVRRGTVLGGIRVMRTSTSVQSGARMVVLHLEDKTVRRCVPGAQLVVARTRRLELDAAVVRAPKRTEIIPAVEDSQTPRSNGRRGVTSRRST